LTVRWARRAEADLAEIFAYIAADRDEAAVRVVDRLYVAGESLAQFPHRGRVARLSGRRELVVDPYVITYRVKRDEVLILTVEHGARRKA
jgi:addiction module RelE/StbE family toxin